MDHAHQDGAWPDGPSALHPRLRRFVFLLASSALLISLTVGFLAFLASRSSAYRDLYRNRLRLARTFAALYEEEVLSDKESRGAALASLRKLWYSTERRYTTSFLCIRDSRHAVILQTSPGCMGASPSRDISLQGEAEPPTTIADLIASRQDWVGRTRGPWGELRISAFAYEAALQGLVAIHVPVSDVEAELRAAALPWAVGLSGLTLLLLLLLGAAIIEWHHSASLKALNESRRALATLMSNLVGMAYRCQNDLKRTMEFVSEGCRELTGYLPADLVDNCKVAFAELIHPEDREGVQPQIKAALERKKPFQLSYRICTSSGEEKWVWEQGRGVFTSEGNLLALEGLMTDVTERRQAEGELIRLRTAIEQTTEGILITNREGDIEYVNPAFTQITGYTREETLGRNPRCLKSGKHNLEFYADLWHTITSGHIWQGEIINRRKDGALYTSWMTITPVRDASGVITNFIAIKEDITERHQMAEQLRQAQKMEAVGRLAGGIAHDFNNVLMVIKGYSELLATKLDSRSRLCSMAGEIHQAADRATGLVRQLLAFSRKQVLHPRTLNLNTVVTSMEKMLQRLIGEDIELTTALCPTLSCVKTDPGQIEQVIMNLAVNARDAMPQGGKLTIESADVELDEIYARQKLGAQPGTYVLLAVTDTGKGMDEETKSRIFEPFFTTKDRDKGTGLGLATVYGIVKQSGGYIWVYSEPGEGTTFKIYLPRVGEVEEPAVLPEPAIGTTGQLSEDRTVLMVEDEPSLRALEREYLEANGIEVLEAGSGPEAIELATEHKGAISLLMTDVVMPGMSGRALAEQIAERRPGIKVLYVSGYPDQTIARHGVLESNTHFLQKPFSAESLKRKLSEVFKS